MDHVSTRPLSKTPERRGRAIPATVVPVPRDPTVFVVEDDEAVRHSVTRLIESLGLHVRSYRTAVEFLEDYDPDSPGCALVDERLPMMTGRALQNVLLERGITLPIILMTAFPEVRTAVSAMKLGAFDFIQKPFREQLLIETLHAAIRKDAELRVTSASRSAFEARFAQLTPRERQVMERVVSGESNREIADALGISKRTVELHRVQVMKKMEVRSLASLVSLYTSFRR